MGSKINKKFAIISVSDKSNIDIVAKKLVKNNYQILSTGGTAKFLAKKNIPNISISKFTEFDEILDGRVKSLHPKIHAGILAKNKKDLEGLKNGYSLIDLVIVNLYPFKKVISQPNCKLTDAIENIDIGGPTMLRAAAKNYKRVTVVTDPNDYNMIINEIEKFGCTREKTRYSLAQKVFSIISDYDQSITNYLSKNDDVLENLPDSFKIVLRKKQTLRYGENPHQKGKLYSITSPKINGFDFTQISGKELSYNNLVDAESAYSCVQQFTNSACVIVKHANPCGVAENKNIAKAYDHAYETDPVSSFGGIIAFNKNLNDKLLAKIIDRQFVEVIIAPEFGKKCRKIMENKPNIRLLLIKNIKSKTKSYDMKALKGNFLIQESDSKTITKKDLRIVTKKKPTKNEIEDLLFAFKVARYVKSNAIVFAKNKRTLGIGAGQMSRIDSTNIAESKAKKQKIKLDGCVMASEAFFPFRDNVDLAKKIGVKSIIQPGGSIKDDEIISITDQHKISMVFTATRVFKH
ncbi:MAG: bifunctional phosphoribosylaminoimidazolecarboxamide formyltransferase/IMP cyclohydrolase [Pseudomonadota bacterium]|nr:bifunctional phosphoribosylaminoimidazolecarboxamide formyltransferase/IMP cyclohydrolase [Pseudomonadota bacterium]